MAIDPVAISFLGLEVYWYGLAYVLAFSFGYFFLIKYSKEFGFTKDFIEDFYFYLMIFSIIGGRLGHVIFYNLDYFITRPLEIFAIWNGGMSIHGGLIGAALTLYIFSKKRKVSFLKLSDIMVIPLALGLAFGRLANYVNQELVGTVTDSRFGVVFPSHDDQTRWPSTLFEGLKNLVTFNILFFLFTFKKLKTGALTGVFLILYSFGRLFVDFVREHAVTVYVISMGQFLSLCSGIIGVYILYKVYKKN